MEITLNKKIYSGADGTSITEDRCEKYLALLRLTEQMGDTVTDFIGIQAEADKRKIFPDTNNIPSAVRTIVPILSKFGFIIEYNRKTFVAKNFFTDAGKMFLYVLDAIKEQRSLIISNNTLSQCIESAKILILQLGLLNMANTLPENKIWIILYLMKRIGYVNMEIFYFTLFYLQKEKEIDDAINEIKKNPSVVNNDYKKEDNTKLEPNPFDFRIKVLRDSGLVVQKVDKNYYFTSDANKFLEQLKLNANNEIKNKQFISLLL